MSPVTRIHCSRDGDAPCIVGKRPVLDRIGAEFLQRHGHRKCNAGRQAYLLSAQIEAAMPFGLKGRDGLPDDFAQKGSVPVLAG